MVVNFKARGISQSTRKLAQTPTLNPKKKINDLVPCLWDVLGSCFGAFHPRKGRCNFNRFYDLTLILF